MSFLRFLSLLTPVHNMPKAKAKVKAVKPNAKAAKKTTKTKATKGAGRPAGSGKYGCKTVAVRVPEHLVSEVQAYAAKMIKAGH